VGTQSVATMLKISVAQHRVLLGQCAGFRSLCELVDTVPGRAPTAHQFLPDLFPVARSGDG
jgi:hypothetical protein